MPHLTIKCFPRQLNQQQTEALAQALSDVLQVHLNCSEAATSIALQYVQKQDWKQQVWDRDIATQTEQLIKTPSYTPE